MTEVDLALVNGRLRTLDPQRPHATALAVADGTIVAVGDDAAIRERCGSHTRVIDLDGAAAVPGLIDSHMHPFKGAVGARGADLLDAHTLDDVLGALAAERAKCAPGEWVQGWGLDYNVFEQTGISSAVIEDAVGGAPAALDLHGLPHPAGLLQRADARRRRRPARVRRARRGRLRRRPPHRRAA